MYRKYSRKGPKVLPIANTSTVLITLFLFLKFTNIMCCCVAIYFLCKFWSKLNLSKLLKNVLYMHHKGNDGELKVSSVLDSLNSDYIVLNNLNLHTENRENQIDHIVISKEGIFNIETKNYSGNIIVYNGNKVFQKTKNQTINISQILSQSKAHEMILKQILGEAVKINSLIVVANEDTSISGDVASNMPIISINDLKSYIENFKYESLNNNLDMQFIEETILDHKLNKGKVFHKKLNYLYKDTKAIFSFGIISLCLLFAIMLVVPKTLKLNFQNSSGNEVQFHNLVLLNDDNDGIIIDKVELSDIYSKLYVSMNEKYMNGNLKLYIIDNKGKQHGCSYYLNKITESNGYYQKSYHIQGISSAEQLCQLKIEYYPNSFDEETTECVVNLR